MIVWRDVGLALATRRHGEADAILEALTVEHGRVAGVVKGGGGRKRARLQPGATLDLTWRARLSSHLGVFATEPVRDRAGAIMADPDALAALSAAAALLSAFLPEREPAPALHAATEALFDVLAEGGGGGDYARWEVGLLTALGYGLSLDVCAATGAHADLVWVSPKSGRAVSRAAGAPYADRLLPLPGFLRGQGPSERADVAAALRLTGHFLDRVIAPAFGLDAVPVARARLAARFAPA